MEVSELFILVKDQTSMLSRSVAMGSKPFSHGGLLLGFGPWARFR